MPATGLLSGPPGSGAADGNDWLVVALAAPGVLHDLVIDTTRFAGSAAPARRSTDKAAAGDP